jgi:alpha-tubulin suppressor-like RCC1 family protein
MNRAYPVAALAVLAACSDQATLLTPGSAELSTDASHTWQAGKGGVWHGYHAPGVTYDAVTEPFELCARWSDDALFGRDGGRYADTDRFSYEFHRLDEETGWEHVGSANTRNPEQDACYVVGVLEEGLHTFRVKSTARHGKGSSATMHHTIAWIKEVEVGETQAVTYRVSVDPATAEVEAGGSIRLAALVVSSDGTPVTDPLLSWASDDEDVATVDAGGLVRTTGRGWGAVRITATYSAAGQSYSGNATVTVLAEAPPPVETVNSLSIGNVHACALDADGVAYCWGHNWFGAIGDGTREFRETPTAVAGGYRFRSIAAYANRTCGITLEGAAYCWGYGYLGSGEEGTSLYPTRVPLHEALVSVTMREHHTCVLGGDGSAHCWGRNSYGELGDGTQETRTSPTRVNGGIAFATLTAGHLFTCGVSRGGAGYCWGDNQGGKLGIGSTDLSRPVPERVAGDHRFVELAPGWAHACGITTDGEAYCWGFAREGELGTGAMNEIRRSPVRVLGSESWEEVVTGRELSCGRTRSGEAYCWGTHRWGGLGIGYPDPDHDGRSATPVRVATSRTFSELSLSMQTVCGMPSPDAIYCWGSIYDRYYDDTAWAPEPVNGWPGQ